MGIFKEDIIACVLVPNKETPIHHYLNFFQTIEEEVEM